MRILSNARDLRSVGELLLEGWCTERIVDPIGMGVLSSFSEMMCWSTTAPSPVSSFAGPNIIVEIRVENDLNSLRCVIAEGREGDTGGGFCLSC